MDGVKNVRKFPRNRRERSIIGRLCPEMVGADGRVRICFGGFMVILLMAFYFGYTCGVERTEKLSKDTIAKQKLEYEQKLEEKERDYQVTLATEKVLTQFYRELWQDRMPSNPRF